MKNETGEFELVLGNRQLLSGFAVVVILFGVFFAMGYIVGRNSTPAAQPAAETASPVTQAPVTAQAPPAPPPVTESAAVAPAETSQIVTQPAREMPETASAPSAATAEPSAPIAEPSSGQTYLQVMAVKRPEAEVVIKTLQDKGFPAVMAPSPKEGMFRVLVGPYQDAASLGKAKASLENAGFHPFVQK